MAYANPKLAEVRKSKQAFCDVCVQLRIVKPSGAQIDSIINTLADKGYYRISKSQARRAWGHFIIRGYYDGHAKDLHIERRVSVEESQYSARYNKVTQGGTYAQKANKYKVTPAKAWEAVSLWLSGASIKEVYETTGVNYQTLYKLIHEYAEEGKLCGKTLCAPLQHEVFVMRDLALKKKAKMKPNRKINKKRMSVVYNGLITNIVTANKFKPRTTELIKKNLLKKNNILCKTQMVKEL